MGFEDAVFGDVNFGDAQIPVVGSPDKNAGNAGTPAPDKLGQQAGSPSATAKQQAGTADNAPDLGDKSTQGDQAKSDGADGAKPLPYDQDPKWKAARAAQRTLQGLLEKHGLLNAEELEAKLSESAELKKVLGKRDPKKVLDDAEYAERVRQNWEKQRRDELYSKETPDETIGRLQQENERLQREYQEYKASKEDQEHAQNIIRQYNTEIDNVIKALDVQLPESELGLLKLVLGIDNPANSIDIEDVAAVRTMARNGISQFQTVVKAIKQAAIDEYVAGKSKLAVDTTKQGTPASPSQGVQRQPLPENITPDEAFAAATNEFAEILMKGLQAAH